MENNIMIKASGVSKEYRLGAIGGTTLREDLQRLGAKIRKKEDPTLRIGQKPVKNAGEKFLALDNVSFEIKKGEAVGIIGHNGAGKSTLLKLITRVTAPSSGFIGLNGRVASMLEVGTGFHPELTGRENIYMNGAILGMSRKEIDGKIGKIIDFSEVRQFIDTPVKRYSSGMYVKLAFSVAAHLDSEIVIMDEVLAVGDMAFQKKCIAKMREAAETEGRTVLYVSHNMNTIRQLCDRVIVLEKGRIIFDGGVEEGIGVYMKQNDRLSLHYDYTGISRAAANSRKIELMGLDIPDGSNASPVRGEDLHFILHCRANENDSSVGVRFEISNSSGQIIGTSLSDRNISGKKGEMIDLDISMNTGNFSPGRYKAVAVLFESDENGSQAKIDRVEPALFFEVREAPGDIHWFHTWWGDTRFDNMKINGIVRGNT